MIYTQLNQYYVVLEVAPQYWQSPAGFELSLCQEQPERHERRGDDPDLFMSLSTQTGTTPCRSITPAFSLR